MTGRMRVIDRWRTRLTANQRSAAECPAHRRWVHRIYVRVYRFLISCYGAGEWQPDTDAESAPGEEPSRMEFVDNTEGAQGTRPKSADRIRATLDAVHDARENPPSAGKRGFGLNYSDWVAVASKSSLVSPRRLVQLLCSYGLEARQVRRGDDVIVEVFAGRLDEAMELLERHRPSLRIRRRSARRPQAAQPGRSEAEEHGLCHAACFGGFVGAVVGALPMLLLMGVLDAVWSPRSSSAGGTIATLVYSIGWGIFVLVGAIAGVWRYYKRTN